MRESVLSSRVTLLLRRPAKRARWISPSICRAICSRTFVMLNSKILIKIETENKPSWEVTCLLWHFQSCAGLVWFLIELKSVHFVALLTFHPSNDRKLSARLLASAFGWAWRWKALKSNCFHHFLKVKKTSQKVSWTDLLSLWHDFVVEIKEESECTSDSEINRWSFVDRKI